MMGLPDGPKSFRIGLVVLIQYRLWQTATQPPSHVAVAITLNAKASSLKIYGNALIPAFTWTPLPHKNTTSLDVKGQLIVRGAVREIFLKCFTLISKRWHIFITVFFLVKCRRRDSNVRKCFIKISWMSVQGLSTTTSKSIKPMDLHTDRDRLLSTARGR